MAQQNLNNNDSASVFRGKLNSMFTELYAALSGALTGWTINSSNELEPTGGEDVRVPGFFATAMEIASSFFVDTSGNLTSQALGAAISYDHLLKVDADGLFETEMLGALPCEWITGAKTLNAGDFSVYAACLGANIPITLPDAETHLKKAYLIKKISGTFNALVTAAGTDKILVGGTFISNTAVTGTGDWILLRAIKPDATPFWVIEASGIGDAGGTSGAKSVIVLTADASLDPENDYIIAGSDTQNTEFGLPSIATVGIVEFTIRKGVFGNYAVTVVRAGADVINLNSDLTSGVTATGPGDWITLKSDPVDNRWYVVAGGLNWSSL